MKEITIPIYRPSLAGNEKRYVMECLDSTWISSKGKFISEFEAQFTKVVGSNYASGVSNGTVALHLALLALGIGQGDEVIVPTLTYIASVNAIAYTGAAPVFVDCEPTYWQLSPEDVLRKVTPKTRAIMAVHLYGHPCDLEALRAIADENDLFLIEDCAEAFGTRIGGRHVGTWGEVSTYSFFGNKTITTGEGGMVVTNDKTLIERVRHFRGQGLAEHREYWHDVIGYNYRMTNICAAIGLAQLEQSQGFIEKKRQLAVWYKQLLDGVPVEVQPEATGTTSSHWMVSIVVKRSEQRDPLRTFLADLGIETRPFFFPIHTMPMYAKHYERHPVAEDLAWRGINLPSWPGLTRANVELICSSIKAYFDSV